MKKLSVQFYVACLVFWGSALSVRMPSVAQAFWVVDERGLLVGEGEVLGRNSTSKESIRPPSEVSLRKDGEVRTEVKTENGEEIKFRSKDGETRTEVKSGGVRVKLGRSNDEVKLKMENKSGEEEDLGKQQKLTIRDRAEKDETEIEAGEKEGEFMVRRGQVEATTRFPLSVNLETNELMVTTPAGERTVTVLPDQAVQNMFAANVIDQLMSATTSGVILGERQGVPVYEIPGVKQRKLLGFIPVTIEQTAVVSAETGELVATEDVSLVEQVIGALSF